MDLLTFLRAQWDRALAYLLIFAGAVTLVIGWAGVHDSLYMSQEMPYLISGGLGGIFLLALGIGFLVTAELRDEWRKLDRIERVLDRPCGHGCHHEPLPDDKVPPAGLPPARPSPGGGGAAIGGPATAQALPGWEALTPPGALVVIGAVVLLVAWSQSAGTLDPDPGVGHLRLGMLSVVLAGAGVAGLTLQIRRRLRGRLITLFLPTLLADVQASLPTSASAPSRPTQPPDPGVFRVIEGGRWYHRPGCPCLSASNAETLTADHLPGHLLPCGLCDDLEPRP
jgi:hypothetical protein